MGSTSLVTDQTGSTVSESRYAPFGELRWTRGASLTDFSFTGQRKDGFGLLDYNARYYSSLLGRFISADMIVPGIGNPLAWDKYVYGYYNPLIYIDPTGHIPCSDDGYCGDPGAPNYQRRIYSQGIEATYNWHLSGDWSLDELKTVYQAGRDVQTYVNKFTAGKGQEWMNEYMGEVSFVKNKSTNMGLALAGASAMVPTDSGMILFTAPGVIKNTVAHELAHVWDINSGKEACAATWCGGGHADALAEYLGGEPSGIRWNNGTSGMPLEYQWDPRRSSTLYGNHSTADYFAEGFSWSIYNSDSVPPSVTLWLQALIYLEVR